MGQSILVHVHEEEEDMSNLDPGRDMKLTMAPLHIKATLRL